MGIGGVSFWFMKASSRSFRPVCLPHGFARYVVGSMAEGEDVGAEYIVVWVNVTLDGAGSLLIKSDVIYINWVRTTGGGG